MFSFQPIFLLIPDEPDWDPPAWKGAGRGANQSKICPESSRFRYEGSHQAAPPGQHPGLLGRHSLDVGAACGSWKYVGGAA